MTTLAQLVTLWLKQFMHLCILLGFIFMSGSSFVICKVSWVFFSSKIGLIPHIPNYRDSWWKQKNVFNRPTSPYIRPVPYFKHCKWPFMRIMIFRIPSEPSPDYDDEHVYWDGGLKKIEAWKMQHLGKHCCWSDCNVTLSSADSSASALCEHNTTCKLLGLRTLELEKGDDGPGTTEKLNINFLVHPWIITGSRVWQWPTWTLLSHLSISVSIFWYISLEIYTSMQTTSQCNSPPEDWVDSVVTVFVVSVASIEFPRQYWERLYCAK